MKSNKWEDYPTLAILMKNFEGDSEVDIAYREVARAVGNALAGSPKADEVVKELIELKLDILSHLKEGDSYS